MKNAKSYLTTSFVSRTFIGAPCRTGCTFNGAPPRLPFNKLMRFRYVQGFLLPAAIFLLVILAGLGAYAINISMVQQSSSVQDVQGARAYHLARAGVEWAAYQIMQNTPDNTTLPACPANTTLSIEGFSVEVTCVKSADYSEQGSDHTIAIYEVTSTAKFGTANTLNYIERQVQVTLSKCLGTDATPNYQCN